MTKKEIIKKNIKKFSNEEIIRIAKEFKDNNSDQLFTLSVFTLESRMENKEFRESVDLIFE